MIKNIYFILLVCFCNLGLSQDSILTTKLNPSIKGLIQYKDNAVRGRFLLDDPSLTLMGFQYGYIIERSIDGEEFDALKGTPIKMWTKAELSQFKSSTKSDPYWVELSHQLASGDFGENKKSSHSLLDQGLSSFNDIYRNLNDQVSSAYLGTVMDFNAALALGIAFVDEDVIKNKNYKYRIRPHFDTKPFAIAPLELSIRTEIKESRNDFKKIVVSEKDKIIDINFAEDSIYFTYFVEISVDSINYTRKKNIPSFQISATEAFDDKIFNYTEDSLTNYVKYYFKIYGKDQFGDENLVGICSGTPKDLTPPLSPYLISVLHIEEHKASISWDIEEREPLKGFKIGRSNKDNDAFYQIHDEIIPPDWRSFTDSFFRKDTNNYYIIEAIDTAGNISKSNIVLLSLIDSIPPNAPIAIRSIMDSLGIVTLELDPQTEKDFMGYRVYKANSEDHEFSIVYESYNDTIVEMARNPILIDTSTVESLSPYIYYKVGALDYHYNESEPSEIIKVKRPDIYPPVTPLINGYKVKEDRIHFDIALSSSFDVRQNYIYRREASEEKWVILDSLGIGLNTPYVDSTGEAGVDYVYSLKAIDESGLESEFGNQLKLRILRNDNTLELTLTVKYFEEENKTLITWESDLPPDITSLTILITTSEQTYKESYRTLEKEGLVVDTKSAPNKVTIVPNSRKKQYASIAESNIEITQNNIKNDGDYKRIQK